mgnify:CR=1 FL=1
MNTSFNQLSKYLEQEPDKTCFILKNNKVIFTSEKKGVKPMIDYYSNYGTSSEPLIVVDRIMGKGAVVLAIFIGANHVVTPVVSQLALDFANSKNIRIDYNKVVPYIINRTKDGQCPIETAVADIDSVDEGYEVIRETLLELNND